MQDTEFYGVSLETISGGAAVEMFNDALEKVIENIRDPNVVEGTVREVNLKVQIKPSGNQDNQVVYLITVVPKLAPQKPVGSFMTVGKKGGKFVAYEQDISQPPLQFDNENEGPAEVKSINGGKE